MTNEIIILMVAIPVVIAVVAIIKANMQKRTINNVVKDNSSFSISWSFYFWDRNEIAEAVTEVARKKANIQKRKNANTEKDDISSSTSKPSTFRVLSPIQNISRNFPSAKKENPL